MSEVLESVTFINGTEGGIFRPIDSNGDGINDGFILADRTDAVLPPDAKCMVFNFEGIGFSQDGGETYSVALRHDGNNWSFGNDFEKFKVTVGEVGFKIEYYNDEGEQTWVTLFDAGSDVNSHTGERYVNVGTIKPHCINTEFDSNYWNLDTGEMYVNGEPLETVEYIPAQYGNARVVKKGNGDCEMDMVVSRGNYFTTVENGLSMSPEVSVLVPTGYFISVFSCLLDAWLPNNAWVMRQGFSTSVVNFRYVCGGGLDSTGGTVCIKLLGKWK